MTLGIRRYLMEWYVQRLGTEHDVITFLNIAKLTPDHVKIEVVRYRLQDQERELWWVFYYAPNRIPVGGAVIA